MGCVLVDTTILCFVNKIIRYYILHMGCVLVDTTILCFENKIIRYYILHMGCVLVDITILRFVNKFTLLCLRRVLNDTTILLL